MATVDPLADWVDGVADPVRLHIVRCLCMTDEATAADLAAEGYASSQTLRRHLEALVIFGIIRESPGESDGQTPGRPAARFSLPPEVRKSVRAVFSLMQ